jgi:thymidine phosphorylase
MNQPLGRMVGNAVEVDESVAALEGRGPDDLMEVTLALGAELLVSAGGADSLDAARDELQQTVDSGAAREKFAEMVAAQGGDLEAPRLVAPASDVVAPESGYITAIDAERLGEAVIAMRGGRQKLGEVLDLSTGFEMLVRFGEKVERGQLLARLFAGEETSRAGREKLLSALQIADERPTLGPLILERLQ